MDLRSFDYACCQKRYSDLSEKDKERYQEELAIERAAMIERGEDPDAKPEDAGIGEGECVFPLGKFPKRNVRI